MLYLGFAQVGSFVSHLWTVFICRVKALFYSFHPSHKLTDVLLVTGPLGQGAFQLTVNVNKASTTG